MLYSVFYYFVISSLQISDDISCIIKISESDGIFFTFSVILPDRKIKTGESLYGRQRKSFSVLKRG